ncbi:MAG TPA: ABC transporter ATP-binding protein [Burkholderiales bacterium]|nr:ABC transporter ATP-binding protein [Burkholderiales bacterium]
MTESSKAILQLRGIRKRFGSALVLDGIDIDVHQGELITFMGPSGCGKTTLLRVIGGFASPDEGRVLLDGNDSTEKPPYERDTAMVFQSYALFPHLSVADNVGYGLRIRGLPKSEIRERVDRLLALVQLQGSGGKSISQLSGGQQQRVALARAFSLEPKVLLLDEPLSNLDANLRLSMREEIRRLQKRLGLTTVLVTHDQYEAMSVSDRIVVMNHGRVQQIGAPVTIYEDPVNEFVADFVGGVNFVPARVESIAPDGKASLVRCALGRLHLDCRGRTLRAGQEITLAIRPETIKLGSRPEVRNYVEGDIDLSMYVGARIEYVVRAGDLRLNVHVTNFGRLPIATGRVTLQIPEDMHVLEAGTLGRRDGAPTP